MTEKQGFFHHFLAIFALFSCFFSCSHIEKLSRDTESLERADGGPLDRGFMITLADRPLHLRCDQLPIRVIAPSSWGPAFDAAGALVNRAVRLEIYSLSGPYRFIVPVVESAAPCTSVGCRLTTNIAAEADTGEIESAYIFVPEGHAYERPTIWVPAVHELLHVLGLAHDPLIVKSIMNERFEMGDDPPPITEEDVARLRVAYEGCVDR